MVSDEPAGDGASSGPPDDPVLSAFDGLARSPQRTVVLAVAVLLVLAYAVLIQQELLLVVWLLVTGFVVYLLWRLVRAHERLARAAERVTDDPD